MALTLTQVERRTVFGDRRVHIFDVTWDSAYATGGESLTAADLGLSRVDLVLCEPTVAADGLTSYQTAYSRANETLQLFNSAGDGDPFDEAGTDDVSTYITRIMAIGV